MITLMEVIIERSSKTLDG